MTNLISIIVPIYKVEKYLERCVKSLQAQTYKNIEIILVDDGSPDNCPYICDNMEKVDERIRVVHKENGGLSSARNAGIEVAQGEYILFVDSDDYISPNMCQRMWETINSDKTDICVCDFYLVDENGNDIETPEDIFPFDDRIVSQYEMLKMICGDTGIQSDWKLVPAWNKLYRKKIFKTCRFEEGRLHEDEFAVHRFVYECENVSLISDKLYYYVQRENSIMNSAFSIKRFDAAYAYKDRYVFLKDVDKELGKLALTRLYVYFQANLKKFDVKSNKEIIGKEVRYVVSELIKKGNVRFLKLLITYLKCVI